MDEKMFPKALMTPARMTEARAKAMHAFERDQNIQNQNLRVLPPDRATQKKTSTFPEDIDSPAQHQSAWQQMVKESLRSRYPPPTTLSCANVQAEKYTVCENPGTMACSACRLVSYCSKECQKTHWKQHKQDCKNPMRSTDWKPSWVRERRTPSFFTAELKEGLGLQDKFSMGMSLWGNTPAMDVINLAYNENDPKKDFSLAFIASGDLRHVLRTFNGLPSDYSGHLNFLVNDFNPFISSRNIVLLLILGNVSETIAADMALHFWYSAFLPMEYRIQLSALLGEFLQKAKDSTVSIPLGPLSTISTSLSKEVASIFLHFMSFSLSIGDIQDEYDHVRSAPSRRDYQDRMYATLKPSHRVAFQEFRRFGIVLPFGAPNAHFNRPNLSLFSPDGKWLQTDYADPLEGWDISAVIDTGKAHSAPAEDIYGCLYFFLSKQLRMLASR